MSSQNRRFLTPSPPLSYFLLSKVHVVHVFGPPPPPPYRNDIVYGRPSFCQSISLTFPDSNQSSFKSIQILLTKLPRLGWAPRRQPVFSTIKNAFLWPSKNISWRKAGTTLHSAKHSRVGTASAPQFYIQLVYRTALPTSKNLSFSLCILKQRSMYMYFVKSK